jgi:ubiquinol-cytochrome c reductase iron-sulfur subunit
MLRRAAFSATTVARVSLIGMQAELRTPVVNNDGVVSSPVDEFIPPTKSTQMVQTHGRYAKYANPAFTKVDTSEEVVLNTYPEGPLEGRLENTGHNPADYKASWVDEDFFRKHVLKQKPTTLDGPELVDFAINASLVGLSACMIRYAVMPIWWIGQPKMTLVNESNVEVEIGEMEDKQCKTVVWRGKPVYVYARSPEQLKSMEETPMNQLKHPETDQERFPDNRRYAVVIAICTHLGCIPAANEGAFFGFFCPCHGSHYDPSARIRAGPAPLNLEVPPNKWLDEGTIYLGS